MKKERLFKLKPSVVFVLILTVSLFSQGLHAQYFGRNKVQYKSFDFKVLKTEHFDIYYYPEMRPAAEQAARMAERWYARFARLLSHELRGRQPLILYANSPAFQQTTTIPGFIGESTGGVTEMFKRRIILPLGASLAASDHVIGHEIVHAFQFDISSQGLSGFAGGHPGMSMPLWMIEGMAEYLSIGADDPQTAMWMRDATQGEKLPKIEDLIDTYEYFPYRWGQSLWAYITGEYGDEAVATIMKSAGRMGGYEAAIQRALGVSLEELAQGWHEAMLAAHKPLLDETDLHDDRSRLVVEGGKYNRYNIAPSLSPDGKSMVLLSTRDMFSIDLFLADTETGEFTKKLISTATNPEFESIQFINSAGSWDASGERFVFGAIKKGEPVLSFIDIPRKKKYKEVKFKGLGEILHPSWGPDGRFVVFSAHHAGYSDLFLYDIEEDKLESLTDDPYADIQPDWSPDGRYIAFVTERFSTDLSLLDIGSPELALVDMETREISKVPGFRSAKNINPQWAPDSRSLFFLSDQNGITNIYNYDMNSREITQVTNLYTGISGITPMSPSLSVAQDSGRIAYSFYEDGNYNIYAMDDVSSAHGEDPVAFDDTNPSVLPPRTEAGGELQALMANPLFGLPEEAEYEQVDYRPKLKLDYISQPSLGVGVDRFGAYAAGGISFNFSDMMGYHNLASTFMISGRIEETVAVLSYQNTQNRINWGAALQRIPYVYGGYNFGYRDWNGEPAYFEQELIYRQINYDVSAFGTYPLSQVQRFELWGGYRILDFQRVVYTYTYSMFDRFLLNRDKQKLPAQDSLYMAYARASLVYDTSMFGATAPIMGQSYILQATPNFGSINYWQVLADYRRYLMPVRPFTLAFRFMHYGRYGAGAQDQRLYPIYMGYETLLRGYTNFNALEAGSPDSVYYQLFGSKMLMANFELRFPLFQLLGVGGGWYGILPMDVYTYFDTAIAWYDSPLASEQPWFLGGDRRPLSSAGVGLRMNLFGYFVMGVSYSYPFDRPLKNGYFQITLWPGF